MNVLRRTSLFLCLALATPAFAQDQEVFRFTLDQAIAKAVESNLSVKIDEINMLSSGHAVESAIGAFDFIGTLTVEKQTQEQPVTSVIFSPTSKTDRYNFGLTQQLPTGADYTLSFNNSKNDSSTPFSTFNPAHSSVLGLALRQPLMRDFGVDTNTRSIRLARNNLGISQEEFKRRMIETVLSTQQAFLDLVFAIEDLKVKQQSLDLAKDQERITQIRIDVGAAAPLDILQPKVDIATRDEDVIIAEASIARAEDRLKQLTNIEVGNWNARIEPVYEVQFRPVDVGLTIDEAVEKAFELRPDVAQAELRIKNAKVNYAWSRNQKLPAVGLRVNYGFAGVGGNQIIRDPDTGEAIAILPGGYDDAFEQTFGFDFPSWTVGVDVRVPLFNTTAKAEAKRAELELERLNQQLDQTKQVVAVEVRQAYRDIETGRRRIAASGAARDSAAKNLDAERKRFDNGMTTNFEILRAQRDLADAQSRELSAFVEYYKSIATLNARVGDLLDEHNISLEMPEVGVSPYERWSSVNWLNFSRGEE